MVYELTSTAPFEGRTRLSTMKAVIVILAVLSTSHALYLGTGGVVGQLTPRTGSKWPPYPGAGLGYYALRAGAYDSLPGFSAYTRVRNSENKRRPKRAAKPQLLGYGGVVGDLTPRTSGHFPGTDFSTNRRSSKYSIPRDSHSSGSSRTNYYTRYNGFPFRNPYQRKSYYN